MDRARIQKLTRQFIKFGMVGFSNTAISYLVYALLVFLGAHYQVANVAAFVLSSLNGFLINKFWVFGTRTGTRSQLLKYYIVYLGSLIIGMSLSWMWIDIAGIDQYVAPVLNLAATVPLNYILSKWWVYR